MSIVFATDFSPLATIAGDVAARLARALGERLVVLHATDDSVARKVGALEREAERLDGGLDTDPVLRRGAPVPAIARFVAEVRPRYVVVGAQGSSLRAAVGTVAGALATQLPVPVLVVREGERFLPFFDGRASLNAVIGDAHDAPLVGARHALVEMAAIAPVQATLLHAPLSHAQRPREADLRDTIGALAGVELEVEILGRAGSVEERLLAAIRGVDPDVVICGASEAHGEENATLGATASFLLCHAPCSVLIAPISAAGVH